MEKWISPGRSVRSGALALVALAAVGCNAAELQERQHSRAGRPPHVAAPAPAAAGQVEAAFRARARGSWVEGSGRVARLLADDRQGSPHQRFVVRMVDGHTVLVVHNLDLAARLRLRLEDEVRFRGRYEWNERGGLVHWTHGEPGGEPGGWIEHQGRRYD
ncbi:MAG TPA: DUF3465 domain-containing protein [Thermoanaerobaculia bacterium]|nr:DUF3465 domain-containing protein [Thermoanaerobaculia bacterium]